MHSLTRVLFAVALAAFAGCASLHPPQPWEKGDLAKMFGVPVKPGGKSPAVDASGKKVMMDRGVTIMRYTVVIDKKGTVAAMDQVTDASGDSKRIAEFVKKLDTN